MMTPIAARKKPVEIQAMRWTGANAEALEAFTNRLFMEILPEDRADDPEMTGQIFDKLHSTWVKMRTGDWVLRGVEGEFYPCAESVFVRTYDLTTGGAPSLLGLELPPNDADAATIRDYLIALLAALWKGGEDFVKRPFGNSGWQYEIYIAMVGAGLVEGFIDSDGDLESVDTRAADRLIGDAIQQLGVTS